MDFEDFMKELSLLEVSDNLTTAVDLVSGYFEGLASIKMVDKPKYDGIFNFAYLSGCTYKALFFLTKHSNEKYLAIIPVVNFLAVHRSRNVPSMFVRAVIHGLDDFYKHLEDDDIKDEIRKYVMKNIDLISFSEITEITDVLELVKHENGDVLVKLCHDEITFRKDKNLGLVLKMIRKANIQHRFDIIELISMAVSLNFVDQVYDIIKKDDKLVARLLGSLKPSVHNIHMKKIIKSHKLNHNDFPDLLRQQRQAHFRFIITNFDWCKAEEKASFSIEDLQVVIYLLEKKSMMNEAYSVFYRYQHMLNDLPQFNKYKGNHGFTLVNNKLQHYDVFLPTSLIKGVPSQYPYLQLSDFNIHRVNVHFITSHNVDLAVEYFKNYHTLGIDCEFYNTDSTSFSETKLATIQIATKDQVYIFDCLELLSNTTFKDFVVEILESPDYTIIGHTFKSDTDVITDTFQLKELNVKNVINVERLYCKNNKVGLAKMVDAILNKTLCKFEQTSSWNRRPLRKAQLHYAALDAVVLLELYDQLKDLNDELYVQMNEKDEQHTKLISVEEKEDFLNKKQLENFEGGPNAKFIIDSMLEKLAKHMRSLGLDTEFNKNFTKKEMYEKAEKENRVILTKNVKLIEKKTSTIIYHLKGGTTEEQIKELIKSFHLAIKEEELMSRCVACNSEELIKKDDVEIDQYFRKVDYIKPKLMKDFWLCGGCGQIYWEGAQYLKAKKQFSAHLC